MKIKDLIKKLESYDLEMEAAYVSYFGYDFDFMEISIDDYHDYETKEDIQILKIGSESA